VFDHVTFRVSDRQASERLYATVLRTIGVEQSYSGEDLAEWNDFSLAAATDEHPLTRRLHVAFAAPSREHVDAFWRVGIDAGFRDDGAPGRRPQYSEDYYGGFLLDPDGNSAEAVHHDSVGETGQIDHIWMRVADVAATKRFYELVSRHADFELRRDTPERVRYTGRGPSGWGSVSFVAGTPSENVHLAFPVRENATVDAFHRELTEAGYRDNGAPGERPIYHPGYYGAFVLDPDGNNIELVNHNRG
jgi:catechol 2,3-dioxygenase-like lactoylglutathione lyase family enzyme